MRRINEKPLTDAERQARYRLKKAGREAGLLQALAKIAEANGDEWASEVARRALRSFSFKEDLS